MKAAAIFFTCAAALAAPAIANEALDILEGNKKVEDVTLPPLAEGEEGYAEADTPPVFTPYQWPESPLDPIWSRAVLFEDESNPWVQQVAIMGLFEWGGAWGEAEVPVSPNNVDLDTTRTRRARLGARLKVFGNTEVEAIGEFAGSANHQELETLKGKTKLPKDFVVGYGKFRPTWSIEGSKDPSQLLTTERTLLASMLMPASTLGVTVGQEGQAWDWSLGWFSADNDRYLPGIRGNGVIAANLAYEGVEKLENGKAMRTRWHLDYLYNLDGRYSQTMPRYFVGGRPAANGPQGPITNPNYRHLVSTGVQLEGERFGFEGDFMLANGDLNAWGLTVTPNYWIVPGRVNLVGRYHYADTDAPGGLVGGLGVGADPLFDTSPLFVGDEFHSFYVGANLHLYQDKVMILNGLEYASMKDQAGAGFDTDAWIWHSAARMSF